MVRSQHLALALSISIAIGCSKSDDSEAPVLAPSKFHASNQAPSQNQIDVAKGTVEQDLVGKWKGDTESYEFRNDGTFAMHWSRMVTIRPGHAERRSGAEGGRWSVKDDHLLMVSDKGIKFALLRLLSEQGKTLEMRAAYAKHGLIYRRVGAVSAKMVTES